MLNLKELCAVVSIAAFVNAPVFASSMQGMHGMHHASGVSKKMLKNPAVRAYVKANKVMHKNMNICYTGNADIDFVEGMIPHHQGAVDMANVVLKYGKDETIRELAKRIIIAQESEIGQMNEWIRGRRSDWRAENADAQEDVKAYNVAMGKMHTDMSIKFTGDADVDFARGMIPHHQGAVDVAWVLKEHGRDFGLRKFADEIIRSQGQEIKLMQDWLKAKGK